METRKEKINQIYDKIRDDLRHATMLYFEEDDSNKLPLLDYLSSGEDVSTGIDEIDNLIEQIEIESLIDAILAIPLDLPSEIEMVNAERAYPMKEYPYSNVQDIIFHADKINTAGKGFREGAKWAIEQVKERNQK